jgi:hypothetical protein
VSELPPEEELAPALPPVSAGSTVSFSFNLGKIAGQGEDSDPILRTGRELGLLAVFDGMGGAGGTVYETSDGPRTGAYLASRVARDVVERRMLELLSPEWTLDGPAAAEDLRRCVQEALVERLAQLNPPKSSLRSKLLRALPTTMALVALQRRESTGQTWDCHILWAGDSRAYAIGPVSGAHQVTVDDNRDAGDAMANLRDDSVLSNMISADTPFVVHHRKIEFTAPFLVIAATDGCFGYLPSPMHFERLLLTTLRDARDTESWSKALQAEISAVTGDDAAMALLGVGADHDGFRRLFAERADEVEERWVRPLEALAADVDQAEQRLEDLLRQQAQEATALWGAYKPDYERYLGREETPSAAEEAQ